MKRTSKQQFIRYTSKYLKDLPVIVTHRGVDNLIVQEVEDDDRRIHQESIQEVPDGEEDTAE